jgi:hypothetical protein
MGTRHPERSLEESAHEFLSAWSSLKYNLTTNDDEEYKAANSSEFMNELVLAFSQAVLERQKTAA